MASRRGQELDALLLLDKPAGLSSNHALQRAKRTLDARKAGHTGTLDPFATGLLICCFGRATKLSAAMLEADKTYEAVLRLGEETDSGDLTGVVQATAQIDPACLQAERIEQCLAKFRGAIEQIPPMVSALKHAGKPLYEYARQGVEIARAPRAVNIYELSLLGFDANTISLRVHCSKGTYVRTLAQDIGRELGCLAHLAELRRTTVGPFGIENAVGLEALQAMDNPHLALLGLHQLPEALRLANPKIS